jgi:tetratricopeptide (TPR) repeat protein
MSNDKSTPAKGAAAAAVKSAPESRLAKPVKPVAAKGSPAAPGPGPTRPSTTPPRPPLFRKIDWWTFGVTTLVPLVCYLLTLAPDLTLEDCGEEAVGSFYAGVPHAPGYPVWTIYSWFFTVILPFSNVAWRVAVSSAVAAALASGLLGLIVSRGSSLILESIEELKGLERRWENALCMVAGFAAAVLLGFNGFMWSQAVIVEVYTLSVLSLMGVLVCLLRWMYEPARRRYLYLAAFLFGLCFNNHQTLIVAAMGLEVAIALAQPKLGRDALFVNVLVFIGGLILKSLGALTTFDNNTPLYVIYLLVGLGSLAGCVSLIIYTRGFLSEWKTVLITLIAWTLGAAFYFYLPIASATNPPMNWAYPRTWDGFLHAFFRGQYERTNPSNIFSDPLHFLMQLKMYFDGAIDEFHLAYLLLALVPFCFLLQMQKRERAWLLGNTAIYLCLAFLLLILLNPATDRQSRDLTKVFFTASHVTIAMFIGFALTLIGAMMITHYERIRFWALCGGAVAAGVALYSLAKRIQETYADPKAGLAGLQLFFHGLWTAFTERYFTAPIFAIYAAVFVLLLTLAFLAVMLVCRQRIAPAVVLGAFALAPFASPLSHWAENEQRGHLFGFWFGHDMFTPPFGLYPEMTRDAVLFGGTDPGRFCPTYMIFCEGFIKPHQRRDPAFDRRDVYIITQNALADGTYLSYIRAHYNRSAQDDPPFLRDMVLWFQSLAMGKKEMEKKALGQFHRTNGVAKAIGAFTNVVAPFDRLIMNLGKSVEARRRREGVYPLKEILTPTVEDSQKCFSEYIVDAQRRLYHDTQFPNEPKQIRPLELVTFTPDGRVQVAGQVAVMAINGLLTKVIFDKNPTNEFFVEESFPLEWMYPYLTPFGIIMKINREPVAEMTEEMVRKDHQFWCLYTERLCGNWITYDTPVKDVCEFVERVYRRGDLAGYTGDPKFVRDNDAQKAFSKLRNSIAGLYAWRVNEAKTPAERSRLIREAGFAFKQAFAFCPYSPETVSRYANLLASTGQLDDALLVAETCQRFDEESTFTQSLIEQLRKAKDAMANVALLQNEISQLEQQFRTNPNSLHAAFNLVSAYLRAQRTDAAYQILDQLVARTNADAGTLLSVANAYQQLGQYQRVEPALLRLVTLVPDAPEVWYDLAGAQTALGKSNEAIKSLNTAIALSNRRLAADPKASNLLAVAAADPRFLPLRALPDFQKLVAPR